MSRAAHPVTVDLPPLDLRAAINSVDAEARTVEVIFTTGAPVMRFDWFTGKRYVEKLSLDPKAVRLDRLNAGASVLDSHSGYSVGDVLGVVQTGSARIEAKQGRATLRFSKRADVEPTFEDIRDGIIRHVSVGYLVHRFEEDAGKENQLPVRTAVDWEPYEISMVPMPADAGARVRAHQVDTHPCVIVMRGAEEGPMSGEKQSETLVEVDPADPGAPAQSPEQRAAAATEPTDRDRGTEAERQRVQGILLAVRAARLTQAFADKLIADGTALVDAQSRVFKELEARGGDSPDPNARPRDEGRVILGDDPFVHTRAGIENALLNRVAPTHFKLTDQGRQYRGLTMLETAKLFLRARGIRTTDLSKNEVAGLALGLQSRGGMHTTSDFPLLLADVANKSLRQEYAAQPQTFAPIGRRVTLPDYKASNRLQLGEAPALLPVKEHGEYTFGSIGEGREQMQLAKYGRKFAITREAIINDDTEAFSRIPAKFGRAARNLESNLVWLQILANGHMGDNQDLFHADHGNLAAAGDIISVASIGEGRAAMRKQTAVDSDGVTFIDAVPRYLLVPPALETSADQFVSTNLLANQASVVNPFSGRLAVISEPRLENGVGAVSGSAIAWYLAASVDQGIDIIEYGYLEGEEGPVVESRIGFDVDGLEIKCRLDFAAKVIDWRGLYKNDGAES